MLPDLGEGLTEADILSWLVAEGDEVALNQPIVEVETAKAAVEVPSPWAGTVRELHAPQGETVAVGAPLITIDTVEAAGEEPAERCRRRARVDAGRLRPAPGRRPRRRLAGDRRSARGSAAPRCPPRTRLPADVTVLAKPPVRKLARDLGVDLRTVRGTGPAGSITREDVGRRRLAPRPPETLCKHWGFGAAELARRRADRAARACARRWLRR